MVAAGLVPPGFTHGLWAVPLWLQAIASGHSAPSIEGKQFCMGQSAETVWVGEASPEKLIPRGCTKPHITFLRFVFLM